MVTDKYRLCLYFPLYMFSKALCTACIQTRKNERRRERKHKRGERLILGWFLDEM